MQKLYSIRQEFIKENQIIEIDVEENEFENFVRTYLAKTNSLTIDDCSFSEQYKLSARIFLKISFFSHEDLEIKLKIIKALGPIFEIALDKSICSYDDKYLLNYRIKGFFIDVKDEYIIFSLGDSNNWEISLSMISLVYALFYNEGNLQELWKIFEGTRDSIVAGGFNSASFNGLQGYYYSRYFVKWLLDMKELAKRDNEISGQYFQGVYDLIEDLKNPKDEILCRRCL